MRQGRESIADLVRVVQEQAVAKEDLVAPSNVLTFSSVLNEAEEIVNGVKRVSTNPVSTLAVGDNGSGYTVLPLAHQHLATYTGIPLAYYNRMRADQPGLLDKNVNTWLQQRGEESRMIRNLFGNTRAILSNRYRRLDNWDLMEAVIPHLMDFPELQIDSCEVTDTRLYIKATTPRIQGEVKRGDIVQMGVLISNSEVGQGRVSVLPFSKRLVCLNGMTHDNFGTRKNHSGARLDYGDESDSFRLYSDETVRLSDAAFFSQVRDIITNTLTPAFLNTLLDTYRDAADTPMGRDNVGTVQVLANKYALSNDESDSILNNLVRGGDLSKWGLGNAITRTAQDSHSYDRASELENLGGRVITLKFSEWKELVTTSPRNRN